MSNTEYSNEFLSRLFGSYMPCKVRSKRSGKMYKASGINYLSESSIKCLLCDEIWLYPKDLKLSLYSLQEISDEDAIEVGKLIGFQNGLTGWGKWYCQNGFPHNCALNASMQIQITDYLRSKGYDCGYAHIPSLIEAGLAVKLVRDEK